MFKNKKAFTLIELLAVIVILAIIALIATPIILGIVEDARKDSFMRSVELVINATDIDIFGKNYTDTYTYTINDGNISDLEVGVKNTDGMNGSITYDKNGNDIYAIHNGKYCVIKESGMKKAEITDYVEGECEIIISTDTKYFTYMDLLTNLEITDIDACVDIWVNHRSYSSDRALSICNNEPQELYDGMTLTQYYSYNSESLNIFDDIDIMLLYEDGIITGTPTNFIVITDYSEEGPKDVIIPSKIDGKTVISIGNHAFAQKQLTSVVIPKSVEYIGYMAFYSNELLQTVVIKNDDIEISDESFCWTGIDESSEIFQKIYNINNQAFTCQK